MSKYLKVINQTTDKILFFLLSWHLLVMFGWVVKAWKTKELCSFSINFVFVLISAKYYTETSHKFLFIDNNATLDLYWVTVDLTYFSFKTFKFKSKNKKIKKQDTNFKQWL